MDTEREARILEGAVVKWGRVAQTVKAIEEFSELSAALAKLLNSNTDENFEAVKYEMADASIMLNQLALIYGDCNEEEIAKLERLESLVQDDG